MSNINMLQYPIGEFLFDADVTVEKRNQYTTDYNALPDELEAAVADLTNEQLDTPYRDGCWTVRQVVHHLADSHMNAYIRFKLVLTEDEPRVHSTDQDAWADLADARTAPIESSIKLFRLLHGRWVIAIQSLSHEDYRRTFWHPWWDKVSIEFLVQSYIWHGRHHIAHITSLRERMGW